MDGNLIQSGLKLPPLSAEINAIRTLAYSNKASLDDFTINHWREEYVFIDRLSNQILVDNYSKSIKYYDIYNVSYKDSQIVNVSKKSAVIMPGHNVISVDFTALSNDTRVFVWEKLRPVVPSD